MLTIVFQHADGTITRLPWPNGLPAAKLHGRSMVAREHAVSFIIEDAHGLVVG